MGEGQLEANSRLPQYFTNVPKRRGEPHDTTVLTELREQHPSNAANTFSPSKGSLPPPPHLMKEPESAENISSL